MVIPDGLLARIAWRALGVLERVERVVGPRSGVSPAGLLDALDRQDPPDGTPVPGWAVLLGELLRELEPSSRTLRLHDGEPIPFEDTLTPIADWATARWRSALPAHPALFTPAGVEDARRFLLLRLSDRSGLVLLRAFRDSRRSGAGTGRSREAFAAHLLGGGWIPLLSEHPVLARQMGCIVGGWIDAMVALGKRLHADAEALADGFARPPRAGLRDGPEAVLPVARLEPGAGDPHPGGRSTLIVTLARGTRVVYKPRDVSAEGAWFRLLGWIDERRDEPAPPWFRVLRVLERDGYGWVEVVEHRRVASEDGARCYYERAGRLACLVYVLGGTDCHFENLVSSGPDPVLVDLETVLQPLSRPVPRSVLHGGLLPLWDASPVAGVPLDLSALGCQRSRETRYPERRWRDAAGDDVGVGEAPLTVRPDHNRPHPDHPTWSPWAFRREVEAGFRSMYRWILREREAWRRPDGPVAWFAETAVRALFRPTLRYRQVLDRGADPDLLSDGFRWSLEADGPAADWPDRRRPSARGILEEEHRALLDGDVPRFEVRADARDLPVSTGRVLEGCFGRSAVQAFARGLDALDEEDLERQADLLRRSLEVWERVRRGDPEVEPYLALSLLPRSGNVSLEDPAEP